MKTLDLLECALLHKGIIVERVDNKGDRRYPQLLSARFRWQSNNSIIWDWPFPDLMRAFLREFYGMN